MQGSIINPYEFVVYVDNLNIHFSKKKTRLLCGMIALHNFSYAHDLVV